MDKLFGPGTSTKEIYDCAVSDLVSFATDGGIATLFAYGQTGSGKTFTISQLQRFAVEKLMSREKDQKRIWISIIDLAGNSAFDLVNGRIPILILEDSFGVTQWAGAKELSVNDHVEVMSIVDHAASFRQTASTLKNDASSRSHSICRIRIEDESSTGDDGLLFLIDLAGSEAARDKVTHGADRMRETREINLSLSVLKDCIRGKVELDSRQVVPKSKQKPPHIPYRRGTLTKVLKHVFDPASTRPCKTVIIACVNPVLADVASSKNTLRYAEMLRVLVPTQRDVTYKPDSPCTWTNADLRDWLVDNVRWIMSSRGSNCSLTSLKCSFLSPRPRQPHLCP